MNYFFVKLIFVFQQGVIGFIGFESVVVWLMDEFFLDVGIYIGIVVVFDFLFVLIFYLQLVLGDLNGFIYRIVVWSYQFRNEGEGW